MENIKTMSGGKISKSMSFFYLNLRHFDTVENYSLSHLFFVQREKGFNNFQDSLIQRKDTFEKVFLMENLNEMWERCNV